MFIIFKYLPVISLILLGFNQTSQADVVTNSSLWEQLKLAHFGQTPIRSNAVDLLFIEVPKQVEDAALMPITIKSLAAQTEQYHIKTLYLIVDNNPQPYSAVFHLSPKLGAINIATRIRMDNFSNVRVIAKMNDNSLHMVNTFVVASGGCSAPASKDAAAASARLGKIQIRLRKPQINQVTPTQVLINHPNASGMQFDAQSRHFIPAHYVTHFDITYNDAPLLSVETGITISENPSIRFNFTPETAGILKATIKDSNGQVFNQEKQVN